MHSGRPQNFIHFPGEIILIESDQQLGDADLSSFTAFGFDTETRPSFKKGDNFKTALLQLATDSVAYVIRLHCINDFEPIRFILEAPNILKVGAAIAHDIRQLQHIFQFQAQGFVELQNLARVKGLKNRGLKGMAEEVMNASISKANKMTNWEREDLNQDQLMYAATDAWIGLAIYRRLKAELAQHNI